ncbi:hypothetical protein Dimus_016422 [Dionaea muscipula]
MACVDQLPSLFLGLILLLFQYSQLSYSLICSTQSKILNEKKYYSFDTCIDLPYHNAHLHWTYNELNSSLSMAFIAPPPSPNGWIAWGINPTGSGMVGAQALIAFKQLDGSMAAKTYDIQSYQRLHEGALSINVSDVGAEYSDSKMMIFATWELPEKPESVNQVWQVGSSVFNGKPERHDLKQQNLASMGRLNLVEKVVQSGRAVGGAAEAPTEELGINGTSTVAPAPVSGSSGAGEPLIHFGVYGLMVVLACAFFF